MNNIFCPIRKKFVALTPEEEVRQQTIVFLIKVKNYPISLISVEGTIKVGRLTKRYDILVFDRDLQPWLLVECKKKSIKITQKVLDQAVRYNLSINAPFLLLTNGVNNFCITKKNSSNSFILLEELPEYPSKDIIS